MRSMYGLRSDIAGKTGTTNNQADAWFIGYTPQIIAGSWVGCDDRVFRFTSERLGRGSAAALPIWAFFMKRVYADKALEINYDVKFKEPAGFDDCNTMDTTSLRLMKNTRTGKTINDDELQNNTPASPPDDWGN
jgi:penicillin-binding protein 1A